MALTTEPYNSECKYIEPILRDHTVGDRHYQATASAFTKRQLRPHERSLNIFGEIAEQAYNRERLENERNALNFIAQNTTIPVPRVIDWSVDDDGVASLVVETLHGRMMDLLMEDRVDGIKLTDEEKGILQRNVDTFIHGTVLPQLAKLRSNAIGQLGGVLFTAPVMGISKACYAIAPPAIRATTERYVYCHNDLGHHNIVIKPDSLEVLSIIDWEYSGFFPPGYEVDLWDCQLVSGVWTHEDGRPADFESRMAMLREEGEGICYFVCLRSLELISV